MKTLTPDEFDEVDPDARWLVWILMIVFCLGFWASACVGLALIIRLVAR